MANLGGFRILLPFFRTSWGVGVRNSAIFNSFHNRVEFGTILEGLRNFGGRGGLNTPPPGMPLLTLHQLFQLRRLHETWKRVLMPLNQQLKKNP